MAQAPFRTAAITATGDITLGATGQLTITASNGNLATSGTVEGATLTDGTLSISSGIMNGVAIINATTANVTTINSSGLTISGGNITGAVAITASGAVTGGSLTDGTATITGGAGSGFASLTSTLLDDGAGATLTGGTVAGNTVTDGTFSTTAGAVSGVSTLAMSGILTVGSGGTTYSFPTARGTAN